MKCITKSQTFACGGKKCCPHIDVFDDGSIGVSDTDPTFVDTITFSPEQVEALRDFLNHLPARSARS